MPIICLEVAITQFDWWAFANGTLIAGAAGALVGALAGGISSFYLARFANRKAAQDAKHGALIRAQYIAITNYTHLENLRAHIQGLLDDPESPEFAIMAIVRNRRMVDIDSLAFVLVEGGAWLMQDIYLAEKSYLNAIDGIEERNQYSLDLEADYKLYGPDRDAWQLEPASMRFRDANSGMLGRIASALARHRALIDDLKKFALSIMPEEKFLSVGEFQQPRKLEPATPSKS